MTKEDIPMEEHSWRISEMILTYFTMIETTLIQFLIVTFLWMKKVRGGDSKVLSFNWCTCE